MELHSSCGRYYYIKEMAEERSITLQWDSKDWEQSGRQGCIPCLIRRGSYLYHGVLFFIEAFYQYTKGMFRFISIISVPFKKQIDFLCKSISEAHD
ncbi:hypothetical protein RHMOL_Rhmol02G0276000 [Rhododendron molle]|uniref:Uncharacterized protein n=1 Tax=Rhododendron molle TaxID=49168 RepID=A0ACC0PW71_RHOML|nr:hypothetical protein RHMOL_Rhmol02G0276000 [Rhododendron molle]